MPMKKYHVCLSADERKKLHNIVTKGTSPAKMIMHANTLLAADENNNTGKKKSEIEIAENFNVSKQTVHNIRKLYSEHGLGKALGRKKRKSKHRVFNSDVLHKQKCNRKNRKRNPKFIGESGKD